MIEIGQFKNRRVELESGGYVYAFRRYSAENFHVTRFGSAYSAASASAFLNADGVFHGIPNPEYADISLQAYELGTQPILERAPFVDRATSSAQLSDGVDRVLDYQLKKLILGSSVVNTDKHGLICKNRDGWSLIIKRILSTDEFHKINMVIVDKESRTRLGASIECPPETEIDEAFLDHASELAWDTFLN